MAVRKEEGCRREEVRYNTQRATDLVMTADVSYCREMQLFLVSFIIVQICEIFTVGGFPIDDAVRKVRRFLPEAFSAHAS